MTDQLMGIDYFSLSTLMKDDDKVFDLKYRYAVPEGATGEAYDNDAAFAAYGPQGQLADRSEAFHPARL